MRNCYWNQNQRISYEFHPLQLGSISIHCSGHSHRELGMKTEWQDMAPPIPKGQPMPQTREYWIQLAARDQELILEQREEINRLKCKINQLQQRHGVEMASTDITITDCKFKIS